MCHFTLLPQKQYNALNYYYNKTTANIVTTKQMQHKILNHTKHKNINKPFSSGIPCEI